MRAKPTLKDDPLSSVTEVSSASFEFAEGSSVASPFLQATKEISIPNKISIEIMRFINYLLQLSPKVFGSYLYILLLVESIHKRLCKLFCGAFEISASEDLISLVSKSKL